jgi:hypothetical protein
MAAVELPTGTATHNRFGFPYLVSGADSLVLVSTSIPLPAVPTSVAPAVSTASAGGQTVVTVGRTLADDGMAAPAYSKRHLYRE